MIYTFYSYKGGVGRSMALANIAELFYRAGQNVLMVDWDLEAPGIERYFFEKPELIIDKPGLMDMLLNYKKKMAKDVEEDKPLELEPIEKFIIDVYPNIESNGRLFLLTAGRRSSAHLAKYAQAVLNFDWHDFYQNWEGELYFEWLRNQFETTADVVLIDSRTGVTEMSGVCTYQLADTVVMFCATNQQNIEGTYEMVRNFTSLDVNQLRPERPLNVLVVPARVEDRAEIGFFNKFRKQFVGKFDAILTGKPLANLNSFWNLKIPYLPHCSFNEALVVHEESQSYSEALVEAFQKLAGTMAKIDGKLVDIHKLFSPIRTLHGEKSYQEESYQAHFARDWEYEKWWEDEDWDTLIYMIQNGDCILMLGPDAATEEVYGGRRPLTEILANQLAEKIDPEIRGKINPSDLAQVSHYYSMERGRHSLEARVSMFYEERQRLTSELHRNLAALPFYLTITTTHDNMFVRALENEGKLAVKERYHFSGDNPDIVMMGSIEKPLIYYFYGAIEEPGSLLLTENDLLYFLVALISQKRPLSRNILSELQDEQKSFLFLGFGFRHWYLRILLHVLQGNYKNAYSFALEQSVSTNIDEFKRNVFFFERGDYKIHIFQSDLSSFAVKLRERYEKGTTIVADYDKKSTIEYAPEVFICYANEDKDYAVSLYKTLADEGIKPWLDKENLRGGDDWNISIRNTINRVDYFVVLQSEALTEKHIGYVNREINAALDRQAEFRRGIRFVIPCKIGDSPLLEDLEHLQAIDLTDKTSIKELTSMIKRDFARRRG